MRNKIVTGLDVGTSSIKALVAEFNGTEWNVLSLAQIPSFGLRRGSVVNVDETSKNIQLLLSGIEKDIGRRINSVFVNIGGNHLHVEPSDGLISVSRADKIVSQEDIDRVIEATKSINIPLNEEILDVFPHEFIIDEQRGIKQPLGLTGVRLEAKVTLLCYFQSYFINLTQAVLGAKLQIDDIIPSPIAAGEAVLSRQQKEIGAAVIDIGAATTSLAVFNEGELVHLAVFPIGSANITNDIAIGLKTDVGIAEDIKKQHGTCGVRSSGTTQSKKKMEVFENNYSLSFTKKQLTDIIRPRATEILDVMQKELKKTGRADLLPGGVVLTGGGAKLPEIKELAKQILKLPVEIGSPKGIGGLDYDPALATVAGLILGSLEYEGAGAGVGSMLGISPGFFKGFGARLRRMFRVFIP